MARQPATDTDGPDEAHTPGGSIPIGLKTDIENQHASDETSLQHAIEDEKARETAPISPAANSDHTLLRSQNEDGNGEKETGVESAGRNSSTGSAPLYTVFSTREKRFIVFMATFAGLVSPLSATIYFPALNVLARDLHVSSSKINLTLTTYMIFQGLAPVFFGDLSDSIGRRPVFILCFLVYIAACIGLALQNSFAALLVLRCLQSAGTSSTVAISVSVGVDVSTHSERGRYLGWVTSGLAIGSAVGPTLGGIFSQFLGWRSIFWFLVIAVGVYMVPLVLFFPETGRNIVGNGSIDPQKWNRSALWPSPKRDSDAHFRTRSSDADFSWRIFPNPFNSIKLIFRKDMGLLLFFNAIVYTGFTTIIASTPYLFEQTFHFNQLQIGLSYIPFGVASFLAPLCYGRLLDWNFGRVAVSVGMVVDKRRAQNMKDFPLEKARVPIALPLAVVGAALLIAYGWVMQAVPSLAAALVLQFFIGLTVMGCFQVLNVMVVDFYPSNPATATAANNLVRCWMGGAGGELIIIMIESIGRGWSFTIMGLIVFLFTPTLLVLQKMGPTWRNERIMKEQNLAERRGT